MSITFNDDGTRTEVEYFLGYKHARTYDEQDRLIHVKYHNNIEKFFTYNKEGKMIDITDRVEFLNRKKVSRFELLDLE